MRDTQSPTGAFPGVAPLAQYGAGDGKGNGDMMRVGWADAGIIVPWTIWKQFGDKVIVQDNWDAMTDGQYGDMPDGFDGDYEFMGY